MSRSTFTTTVRGLTTHCEEDLSITPLMTLSHTDEDYIFRLGSIHANRRTVVNHTSTEPRTIKLDGIAWAEEIYAALEAVKANYSSTSTSSDDSNEAASLTFTPPQRSKSSSKSTSILLDDDQVQHDGVPVIQVNGELLDFEEYENEVAAFEAEKEQRQQDAAREILRRAFSLPERTARSGDQHTTNGEPFRLRAGPGEAHAIDKVETSLSGVLPRRNRRPSQHYEIEGEPSRPTSVLRIDLFHLPPPTLTHLSTAKQPLTPSLLMSLAPALIQWRVLTFYGPFFHRSIQQDVAEDAHACLASRANQIHGVDWLATWETLQQETKCASKSRLLRKSKKWLRSHFSSSAFRTKSNESASVRHVIYTTATHLNIPPTQLELAIESLALAFDPDARRFSGVGLAGRKQWCTLADVLLDDADVLTNPLGPAWMTKPTVETTPVTLLSPSVWARRVVVKRKHNGEGGDKRQDKAKTRVSDDDSADMVLHESNSYDTLVPLSGILFAHKACKGRYFRMLERDEEGKAVYKLSVQEGKLEETVDSEKEIQSAEMGKAARVRNKDLNRKAGWRIGFGKEYRRRA